MRQRRRQTSFVPPPILGIVGSTDPDSQQSREEGRVQSGIAFLYQHFLSYDFFGKLVDPGEIDLANHERHILALLFGSLEGAYKELRLNPDQVNVLAQLGFGVADPSSSEGKRELQKLNAAWRFAVTQQRDALFTVAAFEHEPRKVN